MKGKQRKKGADAKNQDFKTMDKDELREELKHRGLKTTGKRNELLKRLQLSGKQTMPLPSAVHNRQTSQVKNRSSGNVKENGNSKTDIPSPKIMERTERMNIVIWKQPFLTLYYFLLELLISIQSFGKSLLRQKFLVFLMVIIITTVIGFYQTYGSEYQFVKFLEKKFFWCLYWIGLGILSSVGLGTGLHTFLLYLGPHIAAVTLAGYECGSLNFPEPPYPDEIVCPDEEASYIISIWTIMSKVRLEAFMWGAGTALGELPPYFMAKAARLSGQDPDDEDLQEFEELLQHKKDPDQSFLDRAKLAVEKLVERVGFFGILVCASIPNPLFDLAGITCGHFLVPFWTFFGATLIGKAIIKMHIQKLFIIIAFNENHVEQVVDILRYIPYIGNHLQAPFKELLAKQKASLHRKAGTSTPQSGSWLSWVFEKFVILMIAYFVLSIVNSMAQSYHKRMCKQRRQAPVKQN